MRAGDWVRQKYQHDAPERLVCGYLPDDQLLLTWNNEEGYRWVHRWSHDLVREGSPVDRMRAEERMQLKNISCEQHLRWIFGSQIKVYLMRERLVRRARRVRYVAQRIMILVCTIVFLSFWFRPEPAWPHTIVLGVVLVCITTWGFWRLDKMVAVYEVS